MKKYAIILNQKVIQVINWDYNTPIGLPKIDSFAIVSPSAVEVGWDYVDGVFSAPLQVMAATGKKK